MKTDGKNFCHKNVWSYIRKTLWNNEKVSCVFWKTAIMPKITENAFILQWMHLFYKSKLEHQNFSALLIEIHSVQTFETKQSRKQYCIICTPIFNNLFERQTDKNFDISAKWNVVVRFPRQLNSQKNLNSQFIEVNSKRTKNSFVFIEVQPSDVNVAINDHNNQDSNVHDGNSNRILELTECLLEVFKRTFLTNASWRMFRLLEGQKSSHFTKKRQWNIEAITDQLFY